MKFLALISLAPLAAAFAPSSTSMRSSLALNAEAEIQFVKGLTEKVVPAIKLTRAKDGSSGVATFNFASPNVFDASTAAQGEITGMYMVDEEGEMSTTDVNANFANGKPQGIESTYVMKVSLKIHVKLAIVYVPSSLDLIFYSFCVCDRFPL